MGVKTILSVDGKPPDAETAAKLGMKYVHVPIQYKTITPEETAEIAKTFRELEGPFYVHCYHGKHRGPAAAAVGRVVLDGASREQAIAEMRQWCGTSQKYEGLYRVIATGDLPAEAETRKLAWSFPARHSAGGLKGMMVEGSRAFDNLKDLVAKAGARARSGRPEEAAKWGEVIVVAVPYGALPQIGKDYAALMKGKVVIELGNPRADRDGPMANDAIKKGTGVASAAHRLGEEVPGHPDRRQFRVRRSDAFARWLLSFGGDLVPLGPGDLVDEYRGLVRETLAHHRNPSALAP